MGRSYNYHILPFPLMFELRGEFYASGARTIMDAWSWKYMSI
jgi:hypothetical protein